MGWRNKASDRGRDGFVPGTPIKNLSGKALEKALETVVNTRTGKIIGGTVNVGNTVAKGAWKLIKADKCPTCKKRLLPGQEVHPGACARKLATALLKQEASQFPTAMEAQADRHRRWNNITGGIQYDDDGKRIWYDDDGNPL